MKAIYASRASAITQAERLSYRLNRRMWVLTLHHPGKRPTYKVTSVAPEDTLGMDPRDYQLIDSRPS